MTSTDGAGRPKAGLQPCRELMSRCGTSVKGSAKLKRGTSQEVALDD